MQLVIASRNVHKILELRSMLKVYKSLDVLSLLDFPHYTPLPEEGKTFEENVTLKALHAAKPSIAGHLPTIPDLLFLHYKELPVYFLPATPEKMPPIQRTEKNF